MLVRHGETAWSLSGQHTGRTDIPLTENGCRAASELAPHLARMRFSLVLCSPLQRARQTCELAGLGEAPGWLVFCDGCPGGESPGQVAERVDRVIARVRAAEGRVALFAHGHVFRLFAARWLGLDPEEGSRFLLDTSTFNLLSYYRGIPALKCWNASLSPGT